MKTLPHHLATLSTVIWIGGLWIIGYLVVPVLFHTLTDRQLAGSVAGELFEWQAITGLLCGGYLLLYRAHLVGAAFWRDRSFQILLAMLVITSMIRFGIQPAMTTLKTLAAPQDVMQSVWADRFKMWHGISSLLYLTQSLLGAVCVTRFCHIFCTGIDTPHLCTDNSPRSTN